MGGARQARGTEAEEVLRLALEVHDLMDHGFLGLFLLSDRQCLWSREFLSLLSVL